MIDLQHGMTWLIYHVVCHRWPSTAFREGCQSRRGLMLIVAASNGR
jgi:hypothetical protein